MPPVPTENNLSLLMKPQKNSIAVAICTRDRGTDALEAIASLQIVIASFPQKTRPIPLFVVDQSTERESKALLESLSGIFYLPTPTVGLSLARNIAIEAARQSKIEILLFTDDDCTVPPDYIARIAAEFESDPNIALVYTNVSAAPHDQSLGAIPTYERQGRVLVSTLAEKKDAWGIGASIAVRVSAMDKIGGFDESLGAGGLFPAGEDWDIAFRALLLGYAIVETDAVSVLHHGFRSYSEVGELNRRDGRGGGAALGKLLRLRPIQVAPLFFYAFWHFFFWPAFSQIFRLKRPRGIVLAFAFIQGVCTSWHVPTEPKTLRFKRDAKP
jgi:GT2 family glycosyltransferase